MAVQELMAKRNVDVPDDRRMQFRIGVNLGDVLVEGDDILGDGVNVAARLEGAAEPGGIYISDAVRRRRRRRWSPPTTVGWAASRRILGAARRLASRAARLDPALLSQIQVHPCNMILTYRPKALGAVLGPDAGEGEQ